MTLSTLPTTPDTGSSGSGSVALAGAALVSPAPSGWAEFAACQYTDPEVFFPPKGESPAQARRICHRCPVIERCLRWALATAEPHGVLGGQTVQERRALAGVMRAWASTVQLPCPPRGPVPQTVQDAYLAANSTPSAVAA